MKYRIIRDVTINECSWLKFNIKKGDIVYSYSGCTYGCISPKGKAVTFIRDGYPFFEISNDSLDIII